MMGNPDVEIVRAKARLWAMQNMVVEVLRPGHDHMADVLEGWLPEITGVIEYLESYRQAALVGHPSAMGAKEGGA